MQMVAAYFHAYRYYGRISERLGVMTMLWEAPLGMFLNLRPA